MSAEVPITEAPNPRRSKQARIAAVDEVRGAALGGMIVYHLAWDLHAFALLPVDPGTSLTWRLFGHAVASLFLGLSGIGIVLAGRQGFTLGQATRRLGLIACAATAVTVTTMKVAPGATVWFGILHCIVVTNMIALAMRQCSTRLLIVIGALAALSPWILPPFFGDAACAWTGLSALQPATLDFRPVLPWLAPVLLGMAAGRTRLVTWLSAFSSRSAIQRCLAGGGRHSLLIYLLHQPLLIGVLVAIYGLPGTRLDLTLALATPKQAVDFLRACSSECLARGGDEMLCTATCHCVLTAALTHPTPQGLLAGPAPDAMHPFLAACQTSP